MDNENLLTALRGQIEKANSRAELLKLREIADTINVVASERQIAEESARYRERQLAENEYDVKQREKYPDANKNKFVTGQGQIEGMKKFLLDTMRPVANTVASATPVGLASRSTVESKEEMDRGGGMSKLERQVSDFLKSQKRKGYTGMPGKAGLFDLGIGKKGQNRQTLEEVLLPFIEENMAKGLMPNFGLSDPFQDATVKTPVARRGLSQYSGDIFAITPEGRKIYPDVGSKRYAVVNNRLVEK